MLLSDNYYASFYFSKRSLTSLIKDPAIIIFRFLDVFLMWGLVFNNWRISITNFIFISSATIFLYSQDFYVVLFLLIVIIMFKGFYILLKFCLTFLYNSFKNIWV